MATPPSSQLTPYPWQPGPAGWLVLDAGRSTRRALGLVLIVVLLMLLVPVLFMLFWVVVSTGTDKPLGGGLGLGVFAAALALPLGLCISQQSYVTALRVLAYDPWHQEAPLTLTEQTYTPWVPTSAYYRPYHYPYHYPHPFT